MGRILSGILFVPALVGTGCRHGGEPPASLENHSALRTAKEVRVAKTTPATYTSYIVDWDSTQRMDLEAHIKTDGLVAVRYDGCAITPLFDCKASAAPRYDYISVSQKYDAEVTSVERQINILSLGASRQQKEHREVRLVGVRKIRIGQLARSDLDGECDGVTHVATTIYVGARGHGDGDRRKWYLARSNSLKDTASEHLDGNLDACKQAISSDVAPPSNCDGAMAMKIVALANQPLAVGTCSSTGANLAGAAPGASPDQGIKSPRPWKALAIGGGGSLGASAIFGIIGGVSVARSKSIEAKYNKMCNIFPDTDACSVLDQEGVSANRLQIAGLIAAPILLGVGVALLVVATKRNAHKRQVFGPVLNSQVVGIFWKREF